MSRRVMLLVNLDKPGAGEAARAVRGAIESHGKVVHEEPAEWGEPIRQTHGADLVVVLGGDGTLMAQSRRCVDLNLPMLGVNVGKVGFLAEFDLNAVLEQAPRLFGREILALREHPVLAAEVSGHGAGIALNEVVVTAGPPYRMIELCLRIDGADGPQLSGDGLIVSTPMGSTAYNLSAGGPIVSPGVDALAITPIAAHSLAFRPIVVPGESVVELEVLRANHGNGENPGTALVLDGQVHRRLGEGDRVRIARDGRRVAFVRNERASYWSTVIDKLHWGAPPKAREGS